MISLVEGSLLEKDRLPDWLIRFGIRRLLAHRLRDEDRLDPAKNRARLEELVAELKASPIAIETASANAQHYEVPAEFFRLALGRRLKYSSGYWPDGVADLDGGDRPARSGGQARFAYWPVATRAALRSPRSPE